MNRVSEVKKNWLYVQPKLETVLVHKNVPVHALFILSFSIQLQKLGGLIPGYEIIWV